MYYLIGQYGAYAAYYVAVHQLIGQCGTYVEYPVATVHLWNVWWLH